MAGSSKRKRKAKTGSALGHFSSISVFGVLLAFLLVASIYVVAYSSVFSTKYRNAADAIGSTTASSSLNSGVENAPVVPVFPPLDPAAYDAKLDFLAHIPLISLSASTTSTTTPKAKLWPVKGLPYPLPGAILPFKRIVAYYGNFYSKGMGVLGQYDEDTAIQKLQSAVAEWNAADPSTPVVPAIEYIDVTAQGSAGADGKYRLRMPDTQIDHALEMAKKVNGIVILDIQVGLSTVQAEIPLLEKYLSMPEV
ncbi:MAG: hypothetical protein JWN50_69, partial [Parcubacteria group bacterium]|nr:hypothetical protein [Parcubacteria group bacterium]